MTQARYFGPGAPGRSGDEYAGATVSVGVPDADVSQGGAGKRRRRHSFPLFMQVRGLRLTRRMRGQGRGRTADLPLFRPCKRPDQAKRRRPEGAWRAGRAACGCRRCRQHCRQAAGKVSRQPLPGLPGELASGGYGHCRPTRHRAPANTSAPGEDRTNPTCRFDGLVTANDKEQGYDRSCRRNGQYYRIGPR